MSNWTSCLASSASVFESGSVESMNFQRDFPENETTAADRGIIYARHGNNTLIARNGHGEIRWCFVCCGWNLKSPRHEQNNTQTASFCVATPHASQNQMRRKDCTRLLAAPISGEGITRNRLILVRLPPQVVPQRLQRTIHKFGKQPQNRGLLEYYIAIFPDRRSRAFARQLGVSPQMTFRLPTFTD